MDQLEIKKQRQMTFAETFEFCLSSIRHRFMRSILTLCVVILAVAFFMFLQCSNIFKNSVKGGVEQEIIENRRPSRMLKILYAPCTENDFIDMIVDTRKTPSDLVRIQKVIKFSDGEIKKLATGAFDEITYLDFFDGLTIGKRKELFDRREGRERLQYMTEPGIYDLTINKMREFGGIRVPNGTEKLKEFLDGYPEYVKLVDKAYANWTAFQTAISGKDVPRNDSAQLRKYILNLSQSPDVWNKWVEDLKSKGFTLTQAEQDAIKHNQDVTEKMYQIQELLLMKEFRAGWRRAYGQNQYSLMEEKLERLDAKKSMNVFTDVEKLLKNKEVWTEQQLGKRKADANLLKTLEKERLMKLEKTQSVKEADLKKVAVDFRRQKELRDLELELDIDMMKDSSGFSPSQLYLMCLSFLVCVVGITNAMLMSITERFREIATLKCLGATDSFILVQIVLEAMIQGVIGAVVGLLLGFIVALTNSTFQVGFRVFKTFDWGMLGYAALFSLLAGILLSVLSSLYPSMKASRMAPMEAMRVE